MAKKNRGQRRVSARPAPPPPTQEADFGQEYRYVLGDLRRIGVLALAMFAILVALAFILP